MGCTDDVLEAIRKGEIPGVKIEDVNMDVLKEAVRVAEREAKKGLSEYGMRTQTKVRELRTARKKKLLEDIDADTKQRFRKIFVKQKAFEKKNGQTDYLEAFKARFGGTDRLSIGGNNSIYRRANTLAGKWLGMLNGALEEKNLLKALKKGLVSQKDIMKELWSIEGGAQITQNRQAFEIAQIVHLVQKDMMESLQLAGSKIQELPNYIMKQAHDPSLIREAGFDTWKADIKKALNHEVTFREISGSDKDVDDWLLSIYNSIIEGKTEIASGSYNLVDRTSSHRKLHFESAEAFFEYNSKYGKRDFLDSILLSIDSTSRNVSLMEEFGANPRKAFESDKEWVRGQLIAEGRDAEIPKFEKQMEIAMREAEGRTRVPGRDILGKYGAILRAAKDITLLGRASVNSITDLATAAAVLSGSNGRNILQNSWSLFGEWLSHMSKADRAKWSKRLYLVTDTPLAEITSKFSLDSGADGIFGKLHRLSFKMSGLAFQTQQAKLATARVESHVLWSMKNKSWGQLDERVRANLERYEIDESYWEAIRLGEQIQDNTNRGYEIAKDLRQIEYITPEGVAALPDEVLNKIIRERKVRNINGTTPSADEFRRRAESQIASYLTDLAELGSPTPGARQRSFLLRGTNANTLEGQFWRMIAQFKSFPVTMHSVSGRIMLSNPKNRGKTLTDVITSLGRDGDVGNMAGMMIGSTGLAYVAMSANDILMGREPRNPLHGETFAEAFVRGGSAGLYGDFLLGGHAKFGGGTMAAALGPVLSEGFKGADLLNKLVSLPFSDQEDKEEEAKKIGSKFFRMVLNNTTPNLFYTKAALDYLILRRINEYLSPGYLDRLEQRISDNPGLFSDEQKTFGLGNVQETLF